MSEITPAALEKAFAAMLHAMPADGGLAQIDATLAGLEGQVKWRVAPWWDVVGVVQKPWSGPIAYGQRTTLRW